LAAFQPNVFVNIAPIWYLPLANNKRNSRNSRNRPTSESNSCRL